MAISRGKKDTQPIINSHAAEIRVLNKKHLQDKQAMEAKHLDEICMERSRVKLAEERARVASECVNSSSSGAGQQCNDPNVKALAGSAKELPGTVHRPGPCVIACLHMNDSHLSLLHLRISIRSQFGVFCEG